MAKVTFTAIVSEITGRLAGSVFQKSVGGYQLHTLRVPINRRVWSQQKNRVTLEFLASNWRTLTDAQKNNFAGSTERERFTNFISNVFEWGWLKQSLLTTPFVVNPQPWSHIDAAYTQTITGELFINLYQEGAAPYSYPDRTFIIKIREWTPPGEPVNGKWVTYQQIEGIGWEDEILTIETQHTITPQMPLPPVGWKSEIILQETYETVQYISATIPLTASL